MNEHNDIIDRLAFRFWSIHPTDVDAFVAANPMPEYYPGGGRAWFFACEMRKYMKQVHARSRLANQRADELQAKMKVLLNLKDDGTAPVEPGDLTELLFFAFSAGAGNDHPHKMTNEQMQRWRQFVPVPRSTHQRVSAALERSALWRFWNKKALELAEKLGAMRSTR